jgi:pantoate--beta-alanine ligase
MGALHDGHAELVRRCRDECATVVVSIFINPLQFDDPSDLDRYPRDLDADAELLAGLGADLLFLPAAEEMYPGDHAVRIDPGPIGALYEGAARPGHFAGVATVVAKLFHICASDRAYFGRKDAQQLALIRTLVRDLDFAVEVVAIDTVRDPDGLALSSRNARLEPDQRERALGLSAGLFRAREAWLGGERDFGRLVESARAPGLEYDYLACVDPDRFGEPSPEGPALIVAAVRLPGVRLIDNILLERSR